MNWRVSFILVSIAIALLFLFWRPFSEPEETLPQLDPAELQPDFVAEGLFTRIFNPDGELQHRIESTRMAHFSVIGLTELSNPVYITTIQRDDGVTELWQLRADRGNYYDDERLILEDNVRITNEDETSFIRAIETEYLTINTSTQVISTDHPVRIYGPQFEVQGQGMRTNLESQQLELTEHVQTVYFPERRSQ
ncbi:LPS export ABC transporter periplasmic protein LptC [Aliidiomarina sedimenti]|uniref:Lipopolysaccharide export system protein LptC n=1 Tax=Aliidiomarina sedimenti TaxID=1933879 RepID=A0ABY0C066_9GAMM|nr:LPS export ABC transporter periplasmic protein LptC [Aliidiomarina sedimenti]RUO30599.1 LPS export ABC transporter periplasmic protein LptC [Aliidiomarina sedimenti]